MRSKNPLNAIPTRRRLHFTLSRPLWLLALFMAGVVAPAPYSPKIKARVEPVSPARLAGPAASQPAQGVLNDLSSPDQLQQLFQNDRGKLRILALLSPT